MKRLGFKEYLDTKTILINVAENVECYPFSTQHLVTKYCKLVSEDKDINLKPKQSITVEWLYDKIKKQVNIKQIIIDDILVTPTWNPIKLTEWIDKNTKKV